MTSQTEQISEQVPCQADNTNGDMDQGSQAKPKHKKRKLVNGSGLSVAPEWSQAESAERAGAEVPGLGKAKKAKRARTQNGGSQPVPASETTRKKQKKRTMKASQSKTSPTTVVGEDEAEEDDEDGGLAECHSPQPPAGSKVSVLPTALHATERRGKDERRERKGARGRRGTVPILTSANEESGPTDKSTQVNGLSMDEMPDIRFYSDTASVAFGADRGFRGLATFSHGFLAGFALWNTVLVSTLSWEPFPFILRFYQPLAYPAQALYYMLLAICMVSALDRAEFARPQKFFRGMFTMDTSAWLCIVYCLSLLMMLSQAMTNDRICMYQPPADTALGTTEHLPLFLWDEDSERTHLESWRTLILVTAILVLLAWFTISVSPSTETTEEMLFGSEITVEETEQGRGAV
ncbi:uncharacterized protein LOC116941003 isoform X1 [Petromyzon marinus]|uniref:uncharacterized protein LOC116941003 isoform X1 n=2 Tax=Petromyzon marinus TaxID=7757 RepID=UPI003F718D49